MIDHLIKAATCRVACGPESGTGWLIGTDRIVTARHCVLAGIENSKPIKLFFPGSGDGPVIGRIVAQSEDWDACLLSMASAVAADALPFSIELPREGETWKTFGYPQSKTTLGHRLSGTVAQVLQPPKLKIDLDLSVETNLALQAYEGMSGAAVVCQGDVVGMIRLKVDGTIGALSLHHLANFLAANGVALPCAPSTSPPPLLADRGDFSEAFASELQARAGRYLFLEGAHGYGKSTFCGNFQADDKKLINLGAYCLSTPDSMMGANYRAQPQVFLDWLTTSIARRITGQLPRKEDKGYPEQIRQTAEYLAAFSEYCAQRGRQGLFFIDGLNEISGEAMLYALMGLLPAKLPPHVTVVLTAPNFDHIAVPLAGRVKMEDVFALPPLPDSACYHYCQEALKPARRAPALINRICDRARGHPLYLRYLIEYANLRATDNDLGDFPVLTGPIEEYYQGIWAKLLPDGGAVHMLALMARLRWGLSLVDFAKMLTPAEQAQFVSVMSRIRHLLTDEESTTIYHTSFSAFIIENSQGIDTSAYRRLAKFCLEERGVRYCALNRVFHLSRAGDIAVFAECNQAWFDAAVTLGMEPDALIADVDAVLKRAAVEAPADEFFRLTLLGQRISFRYDTLFAQSARLIAEALIVLGRPSDALQHVVRLKTVVVGPDDALEIAFLLHRHGYHDEALSLLERVEQRIIESYQPPIKLPKFLALCALHLQTLFQIRLASDCSELKQFCRIIDVARKVCVELLRDDPEQLADCIQRLTAESPAYFLSFRDEYAELSRIKSTLGADADPSRLLPILCRALLKFENAVEHFHLSKSRKALPKLFADLAELIRTAEIAPHLADAVADTLIRFGASAACVELFAAEGGKKPPRHLQIKATNGVDVNHRDLQECLCEWRVAAFLDSAFRGPSAGIIAGTGWFESIEHLIGALYCCDGRARRAKADSDEGARIACRDQLKAQVIEPLRFSLEQRAAWDDSYAIPETALPGVYRQLAELLSDCFPDELPEWLDKLVAGADGQWGMYSEGYRASVYHVLEQLTREKPCDELAAKVLCLLHAWRDHVLRGVENRHELVPEILRMISIFARLGAREDAERLYQRLLSVSMGPTWYKEDQLCIMTEVLGSVAVSKDLGKRLPQIAGYLERASGEMTFQRYVRSEKSTLVGQIARHGRYRAAFAYLRRQCCGSTEELWAEAHYGPIDKVGPLKGSRFPGGGIDDQAAILALVQHSGTISWALRWALLEIFHCGDSRHLTDYAEAFAKIANEVGALSELVRRAEIVTNAETPSDKRSSFATAFRNGLKPDLHSAFTSVLADLPPVKAPEPPAPRVNRAIDNDDDDRGLFHPGVFGRQSALRDADMLLEEAEKQWALGNHRAAKAQAVTVLQTAQQGGWGIWGNLSSGARGAEEMLVKEETSAANVIRYYAPLIEAECHVPKWIPAQHLIGKVGPLLNEAESQRLLDAVIDHVRLVVGDATPEIQGFGFLADDTPEIIPDVEFFRFIVWLCDHPQWLRRERAAAMLLWLVEQVPLLFSEAVATAFSMGEGYGPDVLCGVLDGASAREPAALWDKILGVLDLFKATEQLRHVSRMVVLERLAARAEKAGSSSARQAVALIKATFTGKHGTGSNPKLPIWAGSLAPEWRRIVKLFDSESVTAWQKELEQICSPLSVTDALTLETAVATSFREGQNRPFSRWESKLRHALNLALWPHVSCDGAGVAEAALRPYNPSQPERTVQGMINPFSDQLMAAMKSGDYSAVLGSNATVLLNYHDVAVKPNEDGAFHVEVLCLLQPISIQRGSFVSQLDQSFRSSELPVASTVRMPFETCCRLKPEVVFFGPFTPATPLPFFQNLVGAKNEDFVRQNWRYGRRNEVRCFGQPERGGCSLSVPRRALTVPAGFKLVWIVSLDDEVVTVVDERNNRLI